MNLCQASFSQPWYSWYFGLDNSLFGGGGCCLVQCRTFSSIPGTTLHVSSQSSPASCDTLGREPLSQLQVDDLWQLIPQAYQAYACSDIAIHVSNAFVCVVLCEPCQGTEFPSWRSWNFMVELKLEPWCSGTTLWALPTEPYCFFCALSAYLWLREQLGILGLIFFLTGYNNNIIIIIYSHVFTKIE